MSPMIEISAHTFSRLQSHAVPLVDTIESVISRLLDKAEAISVEGSAEAGSPGIRTFNPEAPPDLTHSKVLGVHFDGQQLGRGSDTWNGLLDAAIRRAAKELVSPAKVKALLVVNCVEGDKTNEGYRPIPDAGVSVQGQDANGAWRAARHIAMKLGCELSVKFAWREKEGAAYPGLTGKMTVPAG